MKRSPSSETRTADLVPRAWIPVLAAALLLIAYTLARPGPALVGLAGVLLGAGAAQGQRPGPGERALAAGDPAKAAAAFLSEASRGTARDTAFYNAGTAAIEAGRYDVARGALAEAAKSLDPSLRYRALYNLGLAGLLAADQDTTRQEEFLDDAVDRLRQALLLRAHLRARQVESRAGRPAEAAAAGRRWRGWRHAAASERRTAGAAAAGRGPAPGSLQESGGADPQFDGAAGAADQGRPAAAASGRIGRRSEGLVISLLLAAALVQGSGPSLDASVDEDRVSVGEDLIYTLRAVSHSPLPMQVGVAPFTGLEIVSRSERSEALAGTRSHPHHGARSPASRRAARPVAGGAGARGAGQGYGRDRRDHRGCHGQPRGHGRDLEPQAPPAAGAGASAGRRARRAWISSSPPTPCEWASRSISSPRPGSPAICGSSSAARPRCSRRWSTACGAIPRRRRRASRPRAASGASGTICSSLTRWCFRCCPAGCRSPAPPSSTARPSPSSSSARRSVSP